MTQPIHPMQLGRALRAFAAVMADRPFLNLPVADREVAAADLDDATLVKWVRWVLVSVASSYAEDAKRRERSVREAMVTQGIITLALLVAKSNATKGSFQVDGVTYRGTEQGDWRVVIERIAAPVRPLIGEGE